MTVRRRCAEWLAIVAGLLAMLGPLQAQEAASARVQACPADGGCRVDGGLYRIVLPAGASSERRVGAIMYFHGYQGSAEEAVTDPLLLAVAQRLGVALIAMDGMGKSWSFPGSPAHHRDEFAYVGHVLDDVARRFPIDPRRILASGFSQGGSMVWYLACRMPQRFAAFAPIAGAFWEPSPERCVGPRPNLIHVHGTSDTTVPLAGRTLRNGYKQSDVFRSLAVLAPGGCTAPWAAEAQKVAKLAALACHVADGCGGSARLELCLHGGGHMADPAWIERAWRLTMPENASVMPEGARLTSP